MPRILGWARRRPTGHVEEPAATPSATAAQPADSTATAFTEWLIDNGALLPRMDLAGRSPDTGRGSRASSACHEGDVVVDVPENLCLIPDVSLGWEWEGRASRHCHPSIHLSSSPTPPHRRPQRHWLAPHLGRCGLLSARGANAGAIGLAVVLTCERALGRRSQWAPYVTWLYRGVRGGLGLPDLQWKAGERAALAGSAASDRGRGMSGVTGRPPSASSIAGPLDPSCPGPPAMMDRLWNDHAALALDLCARRLSRQAQRRIGARGPLADGRSAGDGGRAAFERALSVVCRYSFGLGSRGKNGGGGLIQALVPSWDALNHVTGACNVRKRHVLVVGSSSRRHDYNAACGGGAGDGRLRMIATRNIAAGAEVINSYGDLTPAKLLQEYGFVEPSWPRDGPGADLLAIDLAAGAVQEATALSGGATNVVPDLRAIRHLAKGAVSATPGAEDGWVTVSMDGKPRRVCRKLIGAICRLAGLPSSDATVRARVLGRAAHVRLVKLKAAEAEARGAVEGRADRLAAAVLVVGRERAALARAAELVGK